MFGYISGGISIFIRINHRKVCAKITKSFALRNFNIEVYTAWIKILDTNFCSINNNFSKEELNLRRKSHATLKKVENDFEVRFSFNTAIAAIMELINFIPEDFKSENASNSQKFCLNETIIFTLKMLFPIAPHISEYLWNTFEVEGPNIESSWPEFETTLIEAEEFELIIQVNGKVRGKINLNKNSSQDMVEQAALTVENVRNFIGSSEIKKTI